MRLRMPSARLSRMPSDGRAVVLLHGLSASSGAWQDVVPLLRSYHEVYAPTAIGHRGGPPVQRRPATIRDVVDWAERYLDEQGLQRPHLVGHSMGGFVAIELARRGRAASVCAIAPGGFWASGGGLRARTMSGVKRGATIGRLLRPMVPFVLKFGASPAACTRCGVFRPRYGLCAGFSVRNAMTSSMPPIGHSLFPWRFPGAVRRRGSS